MAFRLNRLEVAGFRGVNRPFALDLAPGLTAIVGKNGAGKSSLVQAVAWALFGALPASGQPEFRREDALVNAFNTASVARVRLLFTDGSSALVVERVRRLGRTTTGRGELWLRAGERSWRDAAAQAELERRFRLTAAEFGAATLLRQDASRGLAGGSHEERSAAIDRVLGLTPLRELSDNLNIATVTREVNRLGRELESQRASALATTMDLRRVLSQREQALAARQIAPAQLSRRALREALSHAAAEARAIAAALQEAAEGATPSSPTHLTAPESSLVALRQAVSDLRTSREEALRRNRQRREDIAVALARMDSTVESELAVTDVHEPTDGAGDGAHAVAQLSRLQEQQRALRELAITAAAERSALEAAVAEWRSLVSRHGDEAKVGKELESVQSELTILATAGRRQRASAQLLNDAIEALDGGAADRCPVCGQGVDQAALAQRLRSAIASSADARLLEDLRAQYRQTDERRRSLVAAQASFRAAQNAVAAARTASERADNALAAALCNLGEDDERTALAALERQIGAAEARLARLRSAEERRSMAAQQHATRLAARGALAQALGAPLASSTLPALANARLSALDANADALGALGAKINDLDAALQAATSVQEYLALQGDLEQLEAGRPAVDERLRLLEDRHARLSALQATLTVIQAAVNAYCDEALQRLMDHLLPAANRYFDRLGGHPSYSALTVQPEGPRGGAVYWLLAHDAELEHTTYLPTRFSHTQTQVASLAMFFALADRLPSELATLLLDDPAQSMDEGRRRLLATVLADVATRRQVIVTTESDAFVAALREATGVAPHVVTLDDQALSSGG